MDDDRGRHVPAETDPVPDLPSLPDPLRLRRGTPVLLRGPDEVQVGLEPGAAVLLRGSAPLQLLARLEGCATRSELDACAAGAGLGPVETDAVLESLLHAGLLDTAAGSPEITRPPQVRLIGTGPLGAAVAGLLLDAGLDVHAAELDGSGPLPPAPEPPSAGTVVARGRLVSVNHWSKPDRDDLALTVVVADTAEVDRLVTDQLLRADQPHLLLRSSGSTVTVGPLVLPGRTACLRCTDLTRRDADPAWPRLLPQLVRLRRPTGAVLAAWAAAVTATQTLAHVSGRLPEAAGATLELGERDHLMRWRAWPQHPTCGCAWPGTPEWAA